MEKNGCQSAGRDILKIPLNLLNDKRLHCPAQLKYPGMMPKMPGNPAAVPKKRLSFCYPISGHVACNVFGAEPPTYIIAGNNGDPLCMRKPYPGRIIRTPG